MQLHLQPRHEQHLARWKQLGDDPELAKLPYKIETDRFGRIIITPLPFFAHALYTAKIMKLLNAYLPAGEVIVQTPIVTSDGVKVTDAAWISAAYVHQLEGQDPVALKRAPEICVEVLSPSNSPEEMGERSTLYFEAGAQEVWLCGLDGKIAFYTPAPSSQSVLCNEFPSEIQTLSSAWQPSH